MKTPRLTGEQILDYDLAHLWHPYSSVNHTLSPYPVSSASGVYITLSSGEQMIDGMSSWWSAIHGYNHPALNAALTKQLGDMAHVMFGGLTHEPAAQLAKTLADISPGDLNRVFFSDSGSVAVEVAMKMAIQYNRAQGKNRDKFLTIKKGYHGDTFGAMSVCDPEDGMHGLFSGSLMQHFFAAAPTCRFDTPWEEHYFDNFLHQGEACKHSIAAVILEPIAQCAGGMNFYSPIFLKRVREWCDQHEILLIADEIATGFGRTGKLFACEHAGISPDIMCIGKALTGGYLTLAATLCTEQVAQTISQGKPGKFMHGPTFMANPLACAVANASINLLLASNWQSTLARIERGLRSGLTPFTQLPGVKEVRTLGAIGVIELDKPIRMNELQPLLVKQGVWLRPFGNLVYTMPQYISSDSELESLMQGTGTALDIYLTTQRTKN